MMLFAVVLGLIVAVLAVRPSPSRATPTAAPQPAAGCKQALTPRDEVHQLALTIARSHGKPTAAGQQVLDADAAGNPAIAQAVVGSSASGTSSLEVTILATNATPAPASAAGAVASVEHAAPPPADAAGAGTARTGPSRALLSAKRSQGWGGYYYYWCGPGIRANLSFWCHAGGSCAATAFFSDFEVISSNYPFCPGPGPGSCLTTARAQPGTWSVSVDWIRPYQSYTGAPQGYAQWCGL
jgi:hypothetical protein